MNIKEFAGINAQFETPNGEKMSHEELYTKVVNAVGLSSCAVYIPATPEELRAALRVDPLLNTIPLKRWDDQYSSIRRVLALQNITRVSMSQANCVLEQAARMLVERDYPQDFTKTEPEYEAVTG